MTVNTPKAPVIVAGAGIIGASIAYALSARGENVVLIDSQEPGRGASFGNMASIAINGFDAASKPSTWKKIPGWLMNPRAPVTADPLYAPKMVPWFLRFLAAGRSSRVREIEDAGASLATRALADLQQELSAIGATGMLSDTTCLQLYGTEQEFVNGRENLELMDRYGLKYEVLSGDAIHEREPLLNPEISKVVVLPQNHFIADPFLLVTKLVDAMQANGGRLIRAELARAEHDERGVTAVVMKDGRRLETDRLVLAMGVETRTIASDLGESIPLETERGYHTQIQSPGIDLRWSLIWPDRAFMVTPTGGGIRVGGSVEMAGLARAPDWRRARILVEHARYALPSLKVGDHTEWMGHRPSLPDTIPIISASAKTTGLFYATGHGHFGLTYSATTGTLMADLVTGVTPAVDLKPFRIDRF
jgi:D-amino-acid dehydrogenase